MKHGPVFKRIPKARRLQCCRAFRSLLDEVTEKNDNQSWEKFSRCGIGSSKRRGKKSKTQATVVDNRLNAFMIGTSSESSHIPRKFNNQPSL